jgi:hypothetical protein
LKGVPDVVKTPTPPKVRGVGEAGGLERVLTIFFLQKLGAKVKGRLVYTVAELLQVRADRVVLGGRFGSNDCLQFQPLYEMMPEDFTWADTIGADAVMGENKGKKGKKDKSRQQRGVMSYDASLVCYFNPTEYAAAMNMGLYTGPPAEEAANGADGKNKAPVVEPVNPVEEAISAKRRMATYVLICQGGTLCLKRLLLTLTSLKCR